MIVIILTCSRPQALSLSEQPKISTHMIRRVHGDHLIFKCYSVVPFATVFGKDIFMALSYFSHSPQQLLWIDPTGIAAGQHRPNLDPDRFIRFYTMTPPVSAANSLNGDYLNQNTLRK